MAMANIHPSTINLGSYMKMMNQRYVTSWLTTLGITILNLGLLVTMTQPALADYRWVFGKYGFFPPGAFKAGSDKGADLYICRTNIGNGKLHPKNGKCYIPYDGKELQFNIYEVLTGNNLVWGYLTVATPQNSVLGGHERNGDPLYVCAAQLIVAGKSELTPGKYSAVNKICYIPYGGKYYEVRGRSVLILIDHEKIYEGKNNL
jgi:Protein of unknown function (DUF3421)